MPAAPAQQALAEASFELDPQAVCLPNAAAGSQLLERQKESVPGRQLAVLLSGPSQHAGPFQYSQYGLPPTHVPALGMQLSKAVTETLVMPGSLTRVTGASTGTHQIMMCQRHTYHPHTLRACSAYYPTRLHMRLCAGFVQSSPAWRYVGHWQGGEVGYRLCLAWGWHCLSALPTISNEPRQLLVRTSHL